MLSLIDPRLTAARVLATVLDLVLLFAMNYVIDAVFMDLGGFGLKPLINDHPGEWLIGFWIIVVALFETMVMATPGKMVMRLRVTDSEGHKLTFLRSFMRLLLPISLGWFMYYNQTVLTSIEGHVLPNQPDGMTPVNVVILAVMILLIVAPSFLSLPIANRVFDRVVSFRNASKLPFKSGVQDGTSLSFKLTARQSMVALLSVIFVCSAVPVSDAYVDWLLRDPSVVSKTIFVAKHYIDTGTTLTPDMLQSKKYPVSLGIPSDAIKSGDVVVGFQAAKVIGKGRILENSDLKKNRAM